MSASRNSPVSPAYSLLATDFAKLRQCAALPTPGLVFAAERARFAAAIEAVIPADAEVVITGDASISRNTTPLSELLATAPTAAVDGGRGAGGAGSHRENPVHLRLDRCAKGRHQHPPHAVQQSADDPPGYPVLEENRRCCSTGCRGVTPSAATTISASCLPMEARSTSMMAGRYPGKFEATVRNLCDVSPTAFYSVPKAFEELGARMEHDAVLRERFFVRMKYLFYAGAGLPQQTWDTFERLAVETIGQRIQWMTGLGSTETAPFALSPRPDVVGAGIVGLPAPGVELSSRR